jgi:hypothetical protein
MGGGSSKKAIVDVATSLVSTSFIEATYQCQATTAIQQNMHFECKPLLGPEMDVYEDNQNCSSCYENIVLAQLENQKTWATQWEYHAAIPGRTTQQVYETAILDFDKCAKSVCKACIWANNDQLSTVQFEENCVFTLSMVQNMTQIVEGKASQKLTDNQDILVSMAQALGETTKMKTVVRLCNSVMSNFTASVFQEMAEIVNVNQTMRFTSNSSAGFSGMRQVSAVKVLADFVAKNNFVNNMLSEDQWTVQQNIWNDQNTLSNYGDVIANTTLTFAQMADTLAGQVLTLVIIIVVIVLVIVLGIALYNATKKT